MCRHTSSGFEAPRTSAAGSAGLIRSATAEWHSRNMCAAPSNDTRAFDNISGVGVIRAYWHMDALIAVSLTRLSSPCAFVWIVYPNLLGSSSCTTWTIIRKKGGGGSLIHLQYHGKLYLRISAIFVDDVGGWPWAQAAQGGKGAYRNVQSVDRFIITNIISLHVSVSPD